MTKHCLFIFIIFFNTFANPSVWDDIAECILNKCNCFCSDVVETWNDKTIRYKPANCLCPPYNKTSRSGCLKQFSYNEISGLTLYYAAYCAEETDNTDYFNPKIRVRMQTCDFFACWQKSTELNWDGECVVWPTGWVLPTIRFCARIAVPELIDSAGTVIQPADHGYKKGKHLNYEGVEVKDTPIIGNDGKEIENPLPKLCVYKDPGILQLIQGEFDILDINPFKQPFHKASGVHPIAKALQAVVGGIGGGVISFIASVLKGIVPDWTATKWIKNIIEFIEDILIDILDFLEKIIGNLGQLNRLVEDNNEDNNEKTDFHNGLGCVNIPVGPLPPPYYFILRYPPLTPKVEQICPMDYNGNIIETNSGNSKSSPVSSTGCAVSTTANNVIHNAVRVSIDNLIPACLDLESDSYESGKCVKISNMTSIKLLHLSRDVVPICSSNTPVNSTCIRVVECEKNNKLRFCSKNIRLIYGTKIEGDNTVNFNEQYDPKLPECGSNDNTRKLCQTIWGVNIGDYADLVVDFTGEESGYSVLAKNSQEKVIYDINNDIEYNFFAKVTRQEEEVILNNKKTYYQAPSSICVYKKEEGGQSLVGCTIRNLPHKPIVSTCDNSQVCMGDSHLTPKIRVRLEIKGYNYYTHGVAGVFNNKDNPSNRSSDESKYKLNLAGYDYTGIILDEYFSTLPFNKERGEINVITKYGIYKNDQRPIKENGEVNKDAVYLYGLEYMNGKYISGGRYICLANMQVNDCHQDKKMCVLSKLVDKKDKRKLCEESDLSDPINFKCVASLLIDHRVLPDNKDTLSLKDNEYYDDTNKVSDEYCKVDDPNSSMQYNAKKCRIRGKTIGELQLCSEIVQPTCQAITNGDCKNGFAIWDETKFGRQTEGKCINGYEPISNNSLKRYCLLSRETGETYFEELDPTSGCRKIEHYCESLNEAFAIWTKVKVGELSDGKCVNGYKLKYKDKPFRRYCIYNRENCYKPEFQKLSSDNMCVKME